MAGLEWATAGGLICKWGKFRTTLFQNRRKGWLCHSLKKILIIGCEIVASGEVSTRF